MSILGELFGTEPGDGKAELPIYPSLPSVPTVPSLLTLPFLRGQSPKFDLAEDALIEEAVEAKAGIIHDEQLDPPGYVIAAHTLLAFPSLRNDKDGSALARALSPVLDRNTDDGEELFTLLESVFNRLRRQIPMRKQFSHEFVDLVRVKILSDPPLPVRFEDRLGRRRLPLAVNALYRWAQIQGDAEIAVPRRAFAAVLDVRDDVYARALLEIATKARFVELVTQGALKKPNIYRWIGRVIDGEILPAGGVQ
jgi:hypothetical protein